MSETAASTRADEWLTVPQATAHLGISEKTLRRRIKSGALESQKNPKTDGGGTVLLVRVDGVPVTGSGETVNVPDSVPVTFKSEPDSAPVKIDGVPVNVPKMTGARAGHEMDSAPVTSESDARVLAAQSEANLLREALQRERENADQWRAQCEAANTQAATATAALREYLKISAKALPSGEYSQPENSAESGLEAPKSGATGKEAGAAKTGGKRAPRSLWRVILGLR
jgi:uncharacterized Zn-binding protein involved in type VI secretion